MAAMGVEGGEQQGMDYEDYHAPAPLLDSLELKRWSFYRATMAEFVATLLFLYITLTTVVENKRSKGTCGGVGLLGEASAFGGMISVLVYCISAISGIRIQVHFGNFRGSRQSSCHVCTVSCPQALSSSRPIVHSSSMPGCPVRNCPCEGHAGELLCLHRRRIELCIYRLFQGRRIIGTFVLVYTVFSAADPKRKARHSHIPVLAPIPIGLAVFLVHLATIPITGTGINPARSFGPAVIYGHQNSWDDLWIFWAGPLIGAAVATAYHQYLLRASGFGLKNSESLRSQPTSVI